MDNDDLKATHTFGNDTKLRPVTKTIKLDKVPQGLSYTFPAHSLTILKLKVQ